MDKIKKSLEKFQKEADEQIYFCLDVIQARFLKKGIKTNIKYKNVGYPKLTMDFLKRPDDTILKSCIGKKFKIINEVDDELYTIEFMLDQTLSTSNEEYQKYYEENKHIVEEMFE